MVEPSSKRIIHTPSIRKIIGFVDTDNYGIEGLELFFNSTLEGTDGKISYEAAPNGSIIPQANIQTTQPIHGEDLILTLDSELQYLATNLCKEALINTEAFNCSVVFANANTGEVLISAEERGDKESINIDLISTRAQYEPGSSLKIFSIGLALEQGLLDEKTEYYVEDTIELIENSCQKDFKGYKGCYKDFLKHEPYNLSVKEIIERSSNVGTIIATKDLNINDLEEFTINAGLIINKKPVAGLIYAPAKDRMFYSYGDNSSFELIKNKPTRLKCSNNLDNRDIKFVSYSNKIKPEIQKIYNYLGVKEHIRMKSSLKFCVVAAGEYDGYVAEPRAYEWDIAAGHAILEHAGGTVTDFEGNEILYGKKDLKNPSINLKNKNIL